MRAYQLCRELKVLRIQKKMTQKELSEKLGYKSSQFISNWERELCNPPWEALPQLCKLLGMSKHRATKIVLADFKRQLSRIFK